jgi:hypothetical protein
MLKDGDIDVNPEVRTLLSPTHAYVLSMFVRSTKEVSINVSAYEKLAFTLRRRRVGGKGSGGRY